MADAKRNRPEIPDGIYRIGAPVYGGSFQALSADGSSTGLAFVAQGEAVHVALHSQKILEPSPSRVSPECRHFGECGGCHYQHLTPATQVETKQEILRQLFANAGIAIPSIASHAGGPWQYRNRVRLRLRAGRLGYSRRASNEFLPIAECPILSPLLWRAIERLIEVSVHCGGWPHSAEEIELFTNAEQNALQLSVHCGATVSTLDREAPAQLRRLCEATKACLPELAGAGLLVHSNPLTRTSRRVAERTRVEVARWGHASIKCTVAENSYTVSRGSFFQVNRFLTSRMVELVLSDRNGQLAFDLFAGAGLFSVPLAKYFKKVIAVEIGDPALSDLALALEPLGGTAVRETALGFLRALRGNPKQVPDLVLVDPPRAGLGRELVTELVRLAPYEIVYVSCDPTTLVRDLGRLLDSGYKVSEIHLLDMFPQTFHIETIAVLRR